MTQLSIVQYGYLIDAVDPFLHLVLLGGILLVLLEAFASTVDPANQDSLLREMWPIFQEDVPVTFLLPQIWFNAASKRVRGLSSPHRVWAETHMDELWIEEEG